MKRKANGEGSIYQRKDGRWCATVTVGRNVNGTLKRKNLYAKSRESIDKKMTILKNDIVVNGGYVRNDTITFVTWGKRYMKDFVKPSIKDSTYDSYDTLLRNHVYNSEIANMKLIDIKAYHLQPLFNSKTFLSKSYIKKIYILLNKIFDGAVRNDLIPKNPIIAVNIPRSEKEVKEIEVFTIEEQKEYIRASSETSYRALLLTGLLTGMRLGEILALTWDNVDFYKNEIKIAKSVKNVRTHKNGETKWEDIVSSPKTKSGKRTIPIGKSLEKILKDHKIEQGKRAMELGRDAFNAGNYVFCSELGSVLSPRNAQRAHYQTCERAKVKKVGFHALRHTFATRMLENGIDVKIVQTWLGHATIQMTYNIYVHVQEEQKRSSVQVQDDLFADVL